MTMLETKKPTIHAVGSASSVPHSRVRCPDFARPVGRRVSGRVTLVGWPRQLAFTSVHAAARRCTSSALEQAEHVGVLEVA